MDLEFNLALHQQKNKNRGGLDPAAVLKIKLIVSKLKIKIKTKVVVLKFFQSALVEGGRKDSPLFDRCLLRQTANSNVYMYRRIIQ